MPAKSEKVETVTVQMTYAEAEAARGALVHSLADRDFTASQSRREHVAAFENLGRALADPTQHPVDGERFEEAVASLAKVLCRQVRDGPARLRWDAIRDEARRHFRDEARAALDALPYLQSVPTSLSEEDRQRLGEIANLAVVHFPHEIDLENDIAFLRNLVDSSSGGEEERSAAQCAFCSRDFETLGYETLPIDWGCKVDGSRVVITCPDCQDGLDRDCDCDLFQWPHHRDSCPARDAESEQ